MFIAHSTSKNTNLSAAQLTVLAKYHIVNIQYFTKITFITGGFMNIYKFMNYFSDKTHFF